MAPSSAMPAPMSGGNGVTTSADVFGPACGQLPQGSAPGSLDSMGPQPVATAASTNPLLTKLVAAVKATNLVDTLNSQEGITVFAPADSAFEAVGEAKFTELAQNPSQLAPILQYHVVPQRYDAAGLEAAGSVQTLNTAGGPVKIEGSGENMTVNGAKVLCGNIPTENATVFVIDSVLAPGTNK
ncbi:putative surface protein with fasciclin (FAS1) repeats [Amycolatopsis thermoflava]|uniref:Putative surface protein with fasciclin (FAS1) repeats n=2 Tax=Amycolatopsis thermoflava TaxID=84480 RepID=A0A3N2GVB7_9PSEU|nr:putative surface protein with fasciclin (FAS1) repeats [Amycolatopsis thermoflava]